MVTIILGPESIGHVWDIIQHIIFPHTTDHIRNAVQFNEILRTEVVTPCYIDILVLFINKIYEAVINQRGCHALY